MSFSRKGNAGDRSYSMLLSLCTCQNSDLTSPYVVLPTVRNVAHSPIQALVGMVRGMSPHSIIQS
jgi:hypothetical protein